MGVIQNIVWCGFLYKIKLISFLKSVNFKGRTKHLTGKKKQMDTWEIKRKYALSHCTHYVFLYLFNRWKGGKFRVKSSEIAESTGVAPRKVCSSLRELKKLGLVEYPPVNGRRYIEISLPGVAVQRQPARNTQPSQPAQPAQPKPASRRKTVSLADYKKLTWVEFWRRLRENIRKHGTLKLNKILAFQEFYQPKDLSPEIINGLSTRQILAPVSFFASQITLHPDGAVIAPTLLPKVNQSARPVAPRPTTPTTQPTDEDLASPDDVIDALAGIMEVLNHATTFEPDRNKGPSPNSKHRKGYSPVQPGS
jgi:hypothetical protein